MWSAKTAELAGTRQAAAPLPIGYLPGRNYDRISVFSPAI
jgi:hypothetical protein